MATVGPGSLVPIEDHSLLSDLRTAALVSPAGRVVWLCGPRLDDGAVFAELLGDPGDGHFTVRPEGDDHPWGQRYSGDTLVLETEWTDFTVVDFLAVSPERAVEPAGRSDLVRRIEGSGSAVIEFAPRLDFARRATTIEPGPGGLVVRGPDLELALVAPGIEWQIVDDLLHQTAHATVDLDKGPVELVLRIGSTDVAPDGVDWLTATTGYWETWAAELRIPAYAPTPVRRSALTLKALTHGPTGAIAAAPTTSLPESLGGIRNWDYRYCWLRDASLTASSLVRLGSTSEGMALLDWIVDVVARTPGGPEQLRPLYTLDGDSLPPEADVVNLAGYGGSRPVRTGNAADHQVQLDVFGPVAELIALVVAEGVELAPAHVELLGAMVSAVESRWTEPDQGIWEIRAPARHHVYTKVMGWATIDHAIGAHTRLGLAIPESWRSLRDRIAEEIEIHGWSDVVGSFTAAYDGTDLDASVLALARSGLVSSDDPRLASTVQAVEGQLREGSTVYRYRHDDGLTGEEGGFTLMTAWLVDSLAIIGDGAGAQALFDELVAAAGTTGLLTEEVDPETGRGLGNHPQAYSHLGLIDSAVRLAGLT